MVTIRVNKWQTMSMKFEPLYLSALKDAGTEVIEGIRNFNVTAWPASPVIPDNMDADSRHRRMIQNAMIIPQHEFKIESGVAAQLQQETLGFLDDQKHHPDFASDHVAFKRLSKVFTYQANIHPSCRTFSGVFLSILFLYDTTDLSLHPRRSWSCS